MPQGDIAALPVRVGDFCKTYWTSYIKARENNDNIARWVAKNPLADYQRTYPQVAGDHTLHHVSRWIDVVKLEPYSLF